MNALSEGGELNTEELRNAAQGLREALPARTITKPPEEQGRRLATFTRAEGEEELRVSWAEYKGHPFLSFRIWERDTNGQFWPSKERGFTVRLRELPDLAEAIAAAMEEARAFLGGAVPSD